MAAPKEAADSKWNASSQSSQLTLRILRHHRLHTTIAAFHRRLLIGDWIPTGWVAQKPRQEVKS
jgi:hypothetical protein